MFRNLLAAFSSLAILGFVTPCDAQIVRFGTFGGVSIRAPFVAVDVGPYGETRVRAPFTSVYSYGRPVLSYPRGVVGVPVYPPLPPFAIVPALPAYPVPVYPAVPVLPEVVYETPAIPSQGYQVTRPSLDGHVAEDLRRSAIRLQYSLSLRHDGDVWLEYLNPARIIAVIEQGDSPSSLRDLIANFDGVVANGSLRAIYSAGGFNDTRELLRVYVDMQPSQPSVTPRAAESNQAPTQTESPDAPTIESEELPAPAPAPQDNPRTAPAPPAPNPPGATNADPTEV